MGKTATKTKTSKLDSLRWGNSVALDEKPTGILQKSFTCTKKEPPAPQPRHTQNISVTETPPPSGVVQTKKKPLSTLDERVAKISEEVKEIRSLDDLKTYYENFPHIQLRNTATQLVFGDGVTESPIAMVIGEAPGADEDVQGKPFVGRSGQLLDKVLASINLARGENLYISNVVPWRPPGNRTPTDEEIKLLTPLIFRHIELVNPQFLILAGAVSIRSILGNVGGISRIRGRAQAVSTLHENKELKAMPIYHPSYLLRSPGQKAKAWEDMIQIKLQLLTD